jgi:predicted phosphodiesterase
MNSHLFLLLLSLPAAAETTSPFIVSPYVQLGDSPRLAREESLEILFHASDKDELWKVEYSANAKLWQPAETRLLRRITMGEIPPHRVYGAQLKKLAPGRDYSYRVLLNGQPVFASTVRARKSAAQPYRFVVFGDCAQNSPAQKAIALQTYQAKPDFVAIAGDIVYGRGLISEYREKYFPIYNHDVASKETGAPLIRSTLFFGAAGNHDVGGADLGRYPDGMAYFLYWAQPRNGPAASVSDPGVTPLSGPQPEIGKFVQASGGQFPAMASFSFDYGNSHWLVLDSNKYAEWTSARFQQWLASDLESARTSAWRFVIFHHPGFNSSKAHFREQWMKLLAPAFEKGKVDIVFTGHVHNYQRSYPLKFAPDAPAAGEPVWRNIVNGTLALDKEFDGVRNTKPKGVIYLVTGAGGARLYDSEQQDDPASWQPYTTRFISKVYSITVAEATVRKLTMRQVDADGNEIDRFVLTR